MPVKKLEIEAVEHAQIVMMGIVANLPEYLLAHHINQSLQFDFKRYADFHFGPAPSQRYDYPWFSCYLEAYKTTLYLISNHHPNRKMIPELKQVDFFLLFEKAHEKELVRLLSEKIRSISKVTGVMKVNTGKVKHFEMLLEEIEMHEMSLKDSGSVSNRVY